MDLSAVKELLKRYREGRCTDEEIALLEEWYDHLVKTGKFQWDEGEKELLEEELEKRIQEEANLENIRKLNKTIRFNTTYWWAAASVILLIGVALYFQFFKNEHIHTERIATVQLRDVSAPHSNKAMITLADGSKMLLDSMDSEPMTLNGGIKLIRLSDGRIAYKNTSGEILKELSYNTVSNPKGSEVIHIQLADGSHVWLNAGSSLTYPVAFIGDERAVSVSGEAYFEVARDEKKPFRVANGKMNIKVLGTHFNVNAFGDDGQDVEVTLLEGSVEVKNGRGEELLKPGQQARVGNDLKVVGDVDVEAVMAWKNGYFHFENATLQNVMQRISRWYDVDVIYEGDVPVRQFTGEMQRDLSLSEVLKILEKNGVKFQIDGKKLLVLPER